MALVQECDCPRDPGEWLDEPLNDFIGGSEHGRALFSAMPRGAGTGSLPHQRFLVLAFVGAPACPFLQRIIRSRGQVSQEAGRGGGREGGRAGERKGKGSSVKRASVRRPRQHMSLLPFASLALVSGTAPAHDHFPMPLSLSLPHTPSHSSPCPPLSPSHTAASAHASAPAEPRRGSVVAPVPPPAMHTARPEAPAQ